MLWLLIAAAVLAGYGIGRYQPYNRLADWTNWQLRFRLDRWVSRPRQIALFTLLLLTDTRSAVRAWRHRKDPDPPRSPAVTFRTITDDQEA